MDIIFPKISILEATFTLFGQIIIMLLIQIGGLGFILVMALILMWLGKKITLKNRKSKEFFIEITKTLQ